METKSRALSFAIVITSTLALMACGHNKHSDANQAAAETSGQTSGTKPLPTLPGEVSAQQKAQDADRAILVQQVAALAAQLQIPSSVVLDKSRVQNQDKISFLKSIRCDLLLRKLAKAPKNESNVYDPSLFHDLCKNSNGNLELVPGEYLSNSTSRVHILGTEATSSEVTLRKDATVSGYRIMTKIPGLRAQTSAAVVKNGLVVHSTEDRLALTLDVHAISGLYDYSSQKSSEIIFQGSSSAETLVYRKFAGDSILTVSDTVAVRALDGKRTLTCLVTVTKKSGESRTEIYHGQTCLH